MRTLRHCLVLAVLCCGLHATAAEARVPSAPPVAHTASSLSDDLCAALGKPVSTGVNLLVKWMSEGRIRTSLAGTLFNQIGFNPWCTKLMPKLEALIRGAVQKKPALKPRVGPFVFNLRTSAVRSTILTNYNLVTASWNVLDLTSRLRSFFLWYRVSGGKWTYINRGKSALVRIGAYVQFAVRVDNTNGVSSPYLYSAWNRWT